MNDRSLSLMVAESRSGYRFDTTRERLVEVLVDVPYKTSENGDSPLLTYRLAAALEAGIGDIVSVPLKDGTSAGIIINFTDTLPSGLEPERVREIGEIVAKSFFQPGYWQLLRKVADYYLTDLLTVLRVALPPGLLRSSKRRLKLNEDAIPPDPASFCQPIALKVLELLRSSKEGDYAASYINSKITGASRGIRDLIRRGWVESYLEPPKTTNIKLQKAVTLLVDTLPPDLTPGQRQVIEVLRRHGGELWLSRLKELTGAGSVKTLENKGYVVVQEREQLRLSYIEAGKDRPKTLNDRQKSALEAINGLEGGRRALLHGVTGSGKTEVYLQAIAGVLEAGKSALVLVPEIGLTPQLTDRFVARFGNRVNVYHSALSDGERYDTWRVMLTGEPRVIIGTRSAVFAPLPRLGMIILDEEHDSSFKQERLQPNYHARNVAIWRSEIDNCPLILGSATPSLETWNDYLEGRTLYLPLPERVHNRPLPPVEIVDMRRELQTGNRSLFGKSLHAALQSLKETGQQAILFVSRRGHSTFVSCRSCGYVVECPHCDVSLSYHHADPNAEQLLRCHYCNYSRLHPRTCPECNSPYFKFFGSGTQKVTQELTREFPELRCIRFDSDTTRTKNAHRDLLKRFADREADILVGTQMLTKGIDLENVTLVGVMAADGLLFHSDYRAAERTFATLSQVAGRAGRGELTGRVIIQTYNPTHPVIRAVQTHDYEGFAETELMERESLFYPPYGRLVSIRFSGLDGEITRQSAEAFAEGCMSVLDSVDILGPAPATVMRVADRYRWQILLKFPMGDLDLSPLRSCRSLVASSVSVSIDVDPLSMD